jgi:MYXO-CTERM domain-containing protein
MRPSLHILPVVGAVVALPAIAEAACPNPTKADYAWKAPPPAKSFCTADDVLFIEGEIGSGSSMTDVESKLKLRNLACADCVFDRDTDAAWGPIVFVTGGAPGASFVNYGACYATAPGGSLSCGSTYEKLNLCMSDVCSQCAGDAATTSCMNTVSSDPTSCGKYDYGGACSSNAGPLDQACADVFAVIKVMCSAPLPPDAGTSSSGTSGSSSSSSSGASGSSTSSSSSSGASGSNAAPASGEPPTTAPSAVGTSDTGGGGSGCSVGESTSGGPLATALALGVAVTIAASRRRRAR